MSRVQQAVEAALRRRVGARKAKAAEMHAVHFAAQADLHTTCQACGKRRTGTLEQLKQPCECNHG